MTVTPYKFRARYYETDKMGIVHHSNYIRWFEEARVHCLDCAEVSFAKLEEMGLYSPVLSCACEYKAPVRFDDTVIIYPKLIFFNGVRYDVSYTVTSEDGTVNAVGKTSHCFADTNMRPVRLRKKFPEIYEIYLELEKATKDFP